MQCLFSHDDICKEYLGTKPNIIICQESGQSRGRSDASQNKAGSSIPAQPLVSRGSLAPNKQSPTLPSVQEKLKVSRLILFTGELLDDGCSVGKDTLRVSKPGPRAFC